MTKQDIINFIQNQQKNMQQQSSQSQNFDIQPANQLDVIEQKENSPEKKFNFKTVILAIIIFIVILAISLFVYFVFIQEDLENKDDLAYENENDIVEDTNANQDNLPEAVENQAEQLADDDSNNSVLIEPEYSSDYQLRQYEIPYGMELDSTILEQDMPAYLKENKDYFSELFGSDNLLYNHDSE